MTSLSYFCSGFHLAKWEYQSIIHSECNYLMQIKFDREAKVYRALYYHCSFKYRTIITSSAYYISEFFHFKRCKNLTYDMVLSSINPEFTFFGNNYGNYCGLQVLENAFCICNKWLLWTNGNLNNILSLNTGWQPGVNLVQHYGWNGLNCIIGLPLTKYSNGIYQNCYVMNLGME